MKKESPKKTVSTSRSSGSTFGKLFAIFMLIAALALLHFEYETHQYVAGKDAHVMQVNIETGENASVEDEYVAEERQAKDNEISNVVSEDFKIKASSYDLLEQYRVNLLSVAHLSKKFLQHEDYEKEVTFLLKKSDDYPESIVTFLKELRDYRDEHLASKDEEYTKLAIEGGFVTRMVNKIVDVEKKNPQYEIREVEYVKLKSQLDEFVAYFYSKEFLKKYLDHD